MIEKKVLKAYYLEPLGSGLYHLYNPEKKTCYKGTLRGALKKGRRSETSLQPGEYLQVVRLEGTKKYIIVRRTKEYQKVIENLDLHECSYED